MTKLQRGLRDKAVEAFILALEIINKLSITYRLETFAFLFCNAWELLLKAKLHTDKKRIFYRKKPKQQRRSLTLDDCLNSVFTAAEDPIKLNIRQVAILRDQATHLVLALVPADVMALFQAGVLNFVRKLREWFNIDLATRVPPGMMALVYDIDPKVHTLDSALVRRKMPADSIRWLRMFQGEVRAKADTIREGREAFYIPITLRLAMVRNPNSGDIVLTSGPGGAEAVVVEVPKNPDATHPFRQKEVLAAVNAKLAGKKSINQFDCLCIRRLHKIEQRPEYYYHSKFGVSQFSQAFVDWILKEYEKDNEWFDKARAKYRQQKTTL